MTLRNVGSARVSLDGWTLKDHAGLTWPLNGVISAGQSKTIVRAGMVMSLNNSGDQILLQDFLNVERDSFTYTRSAEGEQIKTGHRSGGTVSVCHSDSRTSAPSEREQHLS